MTVEDNRIITACDCCHGKLIMTQKEFDLTYVILCKSCQERELHRSQEKDAENL